MTREEASNILDDYDVNFDGYTAREIAEAFEVAFRALEQESCSDAVSRQAVLDAIDAKAWEFCDYLIRNGRNDEQKPVSHFADNLRECVREELPPVNPQPQPKTGHWKYYQNDKGDWVNECSVCHLDAGVGYQYPYCPNCGSYNGGD